eukprot:10504440-Lingulodinium_polyedra.AAC.1
MCCEFHVKLFASNCIRMRKHVARANALCMRTRAAGTHATCEHTRQSARHVLTHAYATRHARAWRTHA